MTAGQFPLVRGRAVDVARGVVIVGVVYNHVIDGLLGAGIIDPKNVLALVNDAMYILRMPVLAFLIGLFIPAAVRKRGRSAYLRDRVGLMMYLYLVWYAIQGLLEVFTSGVKNNPRDIQSLVTVWSPLAHLWFLPFLAVAAMVVTLTRPYAGRTRCLVWANIFLASSVLLWGRNYEIVGLRGLSLLFFVALGSMIGLRRMATLMGGSGRGWLLAGVGAAGGFALVLVMAAPIPATQHLSAPLLQRVSSLLAAVLGTVAVLALSVALSRYRLAVGLLSRIGRHTLPIYLAHVIVVAGVRVTLSHLGTPPPLVYVVVAMPLGIVVPLVVAQLAGRSAWTSWIFALPEPLVRLRVAAAARRRTRVVVTAAAAARGR